MKFRPQPRTCSLVPPAKSAGFTLVEILVAIGIFSMVLAAIYSTWTGILRASKVGLEAAAAVQRARIAGRTIEETLASVQSFALNQSYYAFVSENGSEAMLSFVSRLSPSFPRSGKFAGLDVRRVTFSLEPAKDGGAQLVLRQTPLLMEMDKDEKNYPLVLAKNVKEFKTEFWDTRRMEWIDEWKQTNQIPVLVRVSLKLADNAYSSQVRQAVTRIVSLPSVTVQPGWQAPRFAPGPGTPGTPGNPATPGVPGNPANSGNPGYPGSPGIMPSPVVPGLPVGGGR
ncbi:MAG TPA: prepilin-type N-terminal cleavage/methylation domain-containing protein [Verrucomicrobiae bacterium]|jgi:type II secretion system protein J|nr:prepilin-type N-terminal cleavage/methylation domain-containing protein [Verrucomicrobiae bacterium]